MAEESKAIVAFRTDKESAEKLKRTREALRRLHGVSNFSWERFFLEAVEIAYPDELKGEQTYDKDSDES